MFKNMQELGGDSLLKQNLFSSISRNLFYAQPFLKPSTQTTSTAFLKEISYEVDLRDLYKIVSSCYINATMKFCPVLLEIRHPLLIKEYQCKYLLQVWNDQGIKVFQRGLQNQIQTWAISNEYFVYKPQDGEQNSDCYHITNLLNENSTILIKDFIKDSACDKLAYQDGVLYIANKDIIYLIDASEKLSKGEVKHIQLNDRKIKEINPGLPIMALFLYREDQKGQILDRQSVANNPYNLLVVSETADNQLDFSQLLISSMNSDKFTYQFRQQKEVVPRDTVKLDRIKKLSFIIDEFNMFYGVTLRETGQLDLYWDMTLVDSPKQAVAFDISVSFDTLYFSTANGVITSLNTTAGSQINYEQVKTEDPDFEFERIFYQNIKLHLNIYNSFTLIRTTLYVAHGPFISLYNIQNNKWLKHMKFEEGEILRMVKTMSKKASGKEKLELAVLLKGGSIYCDVQSLVFSMDESQMNISAKYRTSQVKGKILKTTNDNKHSQWFYIMTKDSDEKVVLNALYYGRLYKIDYGLEELIDGKGNFIPVTTSDSKNTHVLWQRDNHIILYSLRIGSVTETDGDHNDGMFDSNQYQESPTGGQTGRFQARQVDFTVTSVSEELDQAILTPLVNYIAPSTLGNIHSAMSMNISDHLILVDDIHIYRYKIPINDFQQYRNQFCVGLQVIDHKFCYSLSHCFGDRSSGLRLYDINNMIQKNTDTSYMLDNVQVGINGIIDWNHDYSRFSFLKSFNSLNIVPALHRNTIAFIGIGKRETYLATKVIKDKFIALDCKNQLLCWSVVTGKLLSVKRLPFLQDYTNYSVFECSKSYADGSTEYAREWYSKILLTKNTPELDYDENRFFSAEGVRPQISNQETYVKGQQKEFREFKLIEIMSEVEVKEHFSFIHSQFNSQHQGLYFSQNTNYMLEKLNHPRVFLFQKESIAGTNRVKWNFVKRFNKYPQDLENDTGYIRVMSPDFEQYIDINRGDHQFVIRNSVTDQILHKVSKDLMDPIKGDIINIMNRFMWVDNSLIRIINYEGIEKIIDIDNNFKEIEYNVIPLFDHCEMNTPDNHYFTNRPGLHISEVLERLKRKYQAYKSAYYLEHKREPFLLYSELFTVDYQIDKCKGMHVADLSFTYLHWKLMEQIDLGKVPLEMIDDKQIEIMCYNILPGGNTNMHKLHKNGDNVLKIFKIAHPNEEDVTQMQFHIPFIPNLNHKSPMHLCMEMQDLRTMDNMMHFLSAYGIDHHSRTITDILPFIIDKGLPSLLDYLDSRLQQTTQLRKLTKGCINQKSNGIKESQLWFDTKDFQEKLLQIQEESKVVEPKLGEEVETKVERPIKVEFVDLPRLYNFQDELCDDFFNALAGTDQYQIFQKKAVQKLIEFNYPLVKEWTIKKLFIPFMTFQATLFFYLNFIFQIDNPVLSKLDFPIQIVLGMYAFYFLKNELIQIKNDGFAYFTSVWNYIDVITPSTILSVLTINAFQIPINKENERTIQAIGVFFMWFKFLYFFRIFKSYGYLTRLIILVVSDMKDFLVVLFITIVAFSDSLLTISLGNKEEDRFVTDFTDSIIYTYRIVLGDFDVTQFGKVAVPLVYTLFIICTVFNTIVMLNLLIAIISETFAVVKENSENASYQEMASMIAENAYLIPDRLKECYADDNRYIMIVTDLDENMNDEEDFMVQKLDQLKKNILSKIENLNSNINEIKGSAAKQVLVGEKQERQNERIIAMLSQIPGISPNYSPQRRPVLANRGDVADQQTALRQMFSIRQTMPLRQDTDIRFSQD